MKHSRFEIVLCVYFVPFDSVVVRPSFNFSPEDKIKKVERGERVNKNDSPLTNQGDTQNYFRQFIQLPVLCFSYTSQIHSNQADDYAVQTVF